MSCQLDLTKVQPKLIYALSPGFCGQNPQGERLSFTNYYMEIDGRPFFGISGEIHFSRLWEGRWEDALIKMKAAGINTVATYVFWIHHEEEEGVFDFTGCRNLRRFIELCQKHGLYAIVRIGPFDHGEVRNGGLPDWLYGKPFEVRSLDAGFLACTRRLYRRLSQELQGLLYKDGGPIIAAQIDNEYMHSSAPWEITTGISNEWCPVGGEGDAYMLRLRDIAVEEGIDVPFYTCTAWGGAATPQEMMPLWGGYAFRPWIFYSHKGEHPATEEYIYRDNHNNAVPFTYNFEPFYPPESKPYLCCEMGGGMTCCYYYRFKLPFESVDAMANIKLGSGCNMLGYYMFHGGTNPKGRRTPFLNEGQVPKLSYDYQAALGEYSQVRDSYRRLKTLHLMLESFSEQICLAQTVLPDSSQDIDPRDTETLRYAVRLNEDNSGFLFLNNYQDHAFMGDKVDETITLLLPEERLPIDGISLTGGENCVLPFGIRLNGVKLRYALAQPLTLLQDGERVYAFFFAPEGMRPRYVFDGDTKVQAGEGCRIGANGSVVVTLADAPPVFTVSQGAHSVSIVTLSRQQSLGFYLIHSGGRQIAMLTEGALLPEANALRLEHDQSNVDVAVFPDILSLQQAKKNGMQGIFTRYSLVEKSVDVSPRVHQTDPTRYVVDIPKWDDASVKDVLLQIRYEGDIGHAFLDGEMIADNFCNGELWEIGLKEFQGRLREVPLTLYITPLKEGGTVNVESVMAGRKEEVEGITSVVRSVTAKPIYEWKLF